VKLLRKNDKVPIVVCTGSVMLPHVRRLLNARPMRFQIKHAASRLQNPFSMYASYDDRGRLGGVDEELEAASQKEEDAASVAS
jgi:hypothetical protein